MELDLMDMDYSHPIGGTERNVIIFGVDMSLPTKTDNKKKKYFNSWIRSYARIRWIFIICWKNVVN